MKIYTSYFAKLKALKEKDIIPIGIAIKLPYWYKGNKIKNLMPPWNLVKRAKAGEIDNKEYEKIYISLLDQKNPQNILNQIKEISKGKDVALLCYEKNVNDCHRLLAGNWIEKNLMISVKEYNFVH